MKLPLCVRPLLVAVLLLGCAVVSRAAPPAPAAPSTESAADVAYAAFEAAVSSRPPKNRTREEGEAWVTQWYQGMATTGLAFYDAHPTDPRRWTVVKILSGYLPTYDGTIRSPGTEKKIQPVSEAAKAAWARVPQLGLGLMAAPDASPEVKEEYEWNRFGLDLILAIGSQKKGDPQVFPGRFDAHVAKYSELEAIGKRAKEFLDLMERGQPEKLDEIARYLATSPHAAVRATAQQYLTAQEKFHRPVDIAFTAVDGRVVDLKQLRGKVVLVDFWATWCGPCIAELPNVKKVYAAYHDQGFEIVGVALENAKLAPNDTPEQTAAKLAAAKQVLMDFTATNEMPWPQHFDGKHWKNAISTQYDIRGIPAMFLLDQNGMIASRAARGEILETEVKRLLGL